MRWLRPTVPHDDTDAAIEEIEAQLHAAAAEAPPSRRAEEIRASLLDDVGADRSPMPGLAPLALVAGALLLALVIGVGAPAVGSFLGELLDREVEPTEDTLVPAPTITDRAHVDEVPIPTDVPIPTREVPAAPAVEPANVADDPGDDPPADPPAAPAADPQPSVAPAADPSPSQRPWPPSGPPSPMPTPPPTGPPSGPGG